MPLGVIGEWGYEESKIPFAPGQIILIATDGIKEACNPVNEHFGNERLQTVIRDHYRKPAKDILQAVFDALANFRHAAERKDDETLVVIKSL